MIRKYEKIHCKALGVPCANPPGAVQRSKSDRRAPTMSRRASLSQSRTITAGCICSKYVFQIQDQFTEIRTFKTWRQFSLPNLVVVRMPFKEEGVDFSTIQPHCALALAALLGGRFSSLMEAESSFVCLCWPNGTRKRDLSRTINPSLTT